MTPISKTEERIYGTAAPSRVQFLMFGQEAAGKHNGIFHHSDLVPSFRHWLNQEYCNQGQSISLFKKDSKGRCALHVRGSQPSLVDVFCPEGQGLIELNGDSTQFVRSDGLSEEKQSKILLLVARERLAGHQRHQDSLQTVAQ
jgi:hypothetical protein